MIDKVLQWSLVISVVIFNMISALILTALLSFLVLIVISLI